MDGKNMTKLLLACRVGGVEKNDVAEYRKALALRPGHPDSSHELLVIINIKAVIEAG
jgi:hypothetical protein